MVLDIGEWALNKIVKNTKDIMWWIKKQGMGNIFGKMDGIIKEIFKMIKDKDMANYLAKKNVYIKDNGKKEKNYHKSLQIIK